jgi:CheY-like chemotaxis protein
MREEIDPKEPLRVLFADDDPQVVQLFVIYAQQRHWEVDVATRPREVLSMVNTHCDDKGLCYDAIVTDINFLDRTGVIDPEPRVTGTHIVRQIREKYPRIPVVFYTGFDNLLTRKQAELAGGEHSDYVVKSSPEPGERRDSEFDRLLDRVENLHNWVKAREKIVGYERRHNTHNETLYNRRRNDNPPSGDVTVSPVLERLLHGSRLLFRGGEPIR